MSLAIFGFILLAAIVGGAWKNGRAIFVAVCAIMLGVVIAGSSGPLAAASHGAVSGVRTALTSISATLIGR